MRGTVTHTEARNASLAVVNIVARSPKISELELVAALEGEGFSHLHAEKLCVFVPSAFAWALLKRMGLQSFPNHYLALDSFGKEVQLVATDKLLRSGKSLAGAELLPLRLFRISAELTNETADPESATGTKLQ